MPELPEVETVCRGLAAALVGRRLARVEARRPDLRRRLPRDFVARLTGRTVTAVRRRAKYILADLDDGTVLIVHLGMSGRLCFQPNPAPPPGAHDHVLIATDDGAELRFNDARRFGLVALASSAELARHPLLRDLGCEPLAADFSPAALSAALAGKATSIKAALLDQKVIAGLGNIYACEALFRAGISPRRKAASVAGAGRAAKLVPAIKAVLQEAIAAGGSTLRDYVQASGELGYFQANFQVYDRAGQPCVRCRQSIRRIVQSARASYYCPRCQR